MGAHHCSCFSLQFQLRTAAATHAVDSKSRCKYAQLKLHYTTSAHTCAAAAATHVRTAALFATRAVDFPALTRCARAVSPVNPSSSSTALPSLPQALKHCLASPSVMSAAKK